MERPEKSDYLEDSIYPDLKIQYLSKYSKDQDKYIDQLEAEKKVEIDFDGNLKAMISIKDGKVNVLKAVNGYGDAIDINYVTVKS